MHFATTPATITTAALALALAARARAHVILENPRPFQWANDGHFNPLATDGSDFPCKKLEGQTLEVNGTRTVMGAGEPQTLSFQGLAVHGGGSCQLSLTRDLQPTKDSTWMVIHSIEGGCPARHQTGNLEAASQQQTYDFVVPDSFEAGDYVFSWTWSNRISGAPEFYQNCAPITVTNSKNKNAGSKRSITSKKARAATSFPELFMANLGDLTGTCTTSEAVAQQLAIAYPNPGSSVERPEGDSKLFEQPCDGNPRAGAGSGSPPPAPPVASSSPSQPSQPSTSSPSTTAVATPEPYTPTVTTTTIAPPPSVVETTTFITETMTPSAVPTTEHTEPAPSTPTTTSDFAPAPTAGAGVGGGRCTEGELTCMDDGLGFKTCTGGILRPDNHAQQVPPGYKCTPGSGLGLDLHPI